MFLIYNFSLDKEKNRMNLTNCLYTNIIPKQKAGPVLYPGHTCCGKLTLNGVILLDCLLSIMAFAIVVHLHLSSLPLRLQQCKAVANRLFSAGHMSYNCYSCDPEIECPLLPIQGVSFCVKGCTFFFGKSV